MKYLILALALVAASCASPSAPTARHDAASILALSPWTGTTTASDGPNGTASVVFGTDGSVTWTGRTGTFTGNFNASGPGLGETITITVVGNGVASSCRYAIVGALQADKSFVGTYALQGVCIDHSGHGTFRLVQGAL